MYIPPAFAETDHARLFDFIASHSFGLLVSHLDGELFATHMPLLPRAVEGTPGRLMGHVARANPQWHELDGREVLAVFSGPHAYVSPTWYESPNMVPTWNYLAVHALGTCRVVEDLPTITNILQQSVATYERSFPEPWTIDSDNNFFEKLAGMVVGLEIDIRKLEGKWKLGQNHVAERRANAARHLSASADPMDRAIAQLMAATLEGEPNPPTTSPW